MLGPKSSESISQQYDFQHKSKLTDRHKLRITRKGAPQNHHPNILVPRFWDYTWTNWCDLVEGGCPAAEGDDDHLIEEARILWDPELQERIREEILLQQQLPEIYVSK